MPLLAAAAGAQGLDQLSSLFRLLSDRTRLNIVFALAHGERNVGSLCKELGAPQPTISHHLGLLRVNNILVNRRRGKQVYYSLVNPARPMPDSTVELDIGEYSIRISRTPP